MNTARSALSLIITLPGAVPFGKHPDVIQYMKGMSNIKPSVTRYVNIWDPADVLKLLKIWDPFSQLSLELLTLKTVT